MPILPYTTADWDADTLGNHRVLIRVTGEAGAVRVLVPWRLRDSQPENRQLILVDLATGQVVANRARLSVDREALDLVFQPAGGPGLYALYFRPYTGTVQAPYPQIEYLPYEDTAAPDWPAGLTLGELPQAEAVEMQSIDEVHSFFPMEVIATRAETEALLAAHPGAPFLLFPEDRRLSIRMEADLPHRWIEAGPERPLRAEARRGAYFTFQVGVFAARAALQSLTVEFTGLRDLSGRPAVPPEDFTCFNLGGVDWFGVPFTKSADVPQGQVQALWCGLPIPEGLAPGEYSGEVTVSAENAPGRAVPVQIRVLPEAAPSGGDDDPAELSRLRWLNSRIALDDEVVAPFTPIEAQGSTFHILGRAVTVNPGGFPERITSFFSEEMTGFEGAREILAAPVTLTVEGAAGEAMSCQWDQPFQVTYHSPGVVKWQSAGSAGALSLALEAVLEADGTLEYTLKVEAREAADLGDIRLEVPYAPDVARYMLGLGFRGGFRPPSFDWTWDVQHRNQDSLWLGDVNAGLQVTLKDERYQRPLNTNFYAFKPLVAPRSWENGGRGGIRFAEETGAVRARFFSGPRPMRPGEALYYNFRLAVTPFKPLDTEGQWSTRYFHRYAPVDDVAAAGANTINVHHATEINPYINYPFLRPEAMKAYIDQAHARGMKVKIYYTVRELTNRSPELFALRSLGDEVLSFGPGGGHSWLQEHLVDNYVTGWHVYRIRDVAVVNSGTSRWHNFYLEGLDWLARNIGIDGLYIDDLAFDRVVMKRVRKILDRRRPGALIDLHSANQFRERDGFANSANLYMEHFPYLNRLWFGEYFDYNLAPDFWMVEVSGIPFGLMGEMLQDGGNPWRGMVYGMTGRLPWSGDPTAMWRAWDAAGIAGSRMIGYWSSRCPVRTGRDDILATVYQKEDGALIALASWHPEPAAVRLEIDWPALGLDPAGAELAAPAIEKFQEAAVFAPGDAIPVEPGEGWLLVLRKRGAA